MYWVEFVQKLFVLSRVLYGSYLCQTDFSRSCLYWVVFFTEVIYAEHIFPEVICIESGFVQKLLIPSRFFQKLFVLIRVLYRNYLCRTDFSTSCLYSVGFCTEVTNSEQIFPEAVYIDSCFIQKLFVRNRFFHKLFVFSRFLYISYWYWDRFLSVVIFFESCYCRSYFHLDSVQKLFVWVGSLQKLFALTLYWSYVYWVRVLYRRYVYWVTFCTECISIESRLHSLFYIYESILLNRLTQCILSYFLLVKSPAFRSLASIALTNSVMEQQNELVSVLRRINIMTPQVLSFPLHKINGLYFMKRRNKFNVCTSVSLWAR